MKYVVVTGGVVSGLGKGISISSLGVLLRACGLRVTSIKIDPYLVSFARAPARHRVLQCPPCLPRAAGLNARAPPRRAGAPLPTRKLACWRRARFSWRCKGPPRPQIEARPGSCKAPHAERLGGPLATSVLPQTARAARPASGLSGCSKMQFKRAPPARVFPAVQGRLGLQAWSPLPDARHCSQCRGGGRVQTLRACVTAASCHRLRLRTRSRSDCSVVGAARSPRHCSPALLAPRLRPAEHRCGHHVALRARRGLRLGRRRGGESRVWTCRASGGAARFWDGVATHHWSAVCVIAPPLRAGRP